MDKSSESYLRNLAPAWKAAESSGNYSGIASLLKGVDPNVLASTFGFRPEDMAYLTEKTGYAWNAEPPLTYYPPDIIPPPPPPPPPVTYHDTESPQPGPEWDLLYRQLQNEGLINGPTPTESPLTYYPDPVLQQPPSPPTQLPPQLPPPPPPAKPPLTYTEPPLTYYPPDIIPPPPPPPPSVTYHDTPVRQPVPMELQRPMMPQAQDRVIF